MLYGKKKPVFEAEFIFSIISKLPSRHSVRILEHDRSRNKDVSLLEQFQNSADECGYGSIMPSFFAKGLNSSNVDT